MASPIPFLDLTKQWALLEEEVMAAIRSTLGKAEFSGGENIQEFEKAFAEFCGVSHAVALNNGTSALHLSMILSGVGNGDEVIVPTNSFIATAWAPVYVNATPVFVDCDARDWQIDIDDVKRKITSKTKAIIGVHLYGKPCIVDELLDIANENNLVLIEDCAQSHGALYKGKPVGSFGKMGCFSFYPSKNLGTYGEGGAITTNDEAVYDRALRLRNNGSSTKYYHDEIGYNMRMGGMEVAVLKVKMNYLKEWNEKRKAIADKYYRLINNPLVQLQARDAERESVHHLFVVTSTDRNKLIKHLNDNNIFPGIHYPVPCHLQNAFRYLAHKKGDFPNAEYLADHCLSLPMYPELTDEETDRVVEAVNNFKL